MRDRDIRAALHATDLARFKREPGTLVLDEFGIMNGEHRIDIAAINGAMHGWEIKSPSDTLYRLPAQRDAYGKVFDYITIIVGATHLNDVQEMVPSWWAISEATTTHAGELRLRRVRKGRRNPAPDPYSIAQLLWRDEVIHLLRLAGLRGKELTGMRKRLWEKLVQTHDFPELARLVRALLKQRGDWRLSEGVGEAEFAKQEHDVVRGSDLDEHLRATFAVAV